MSSFRRRPLPTISAHEVASHSSVKSCYVTLGTKVYDITSFLDDHPGGGDLILDFAAKDVSEIMGDGVSHLHSQSAYEILDEYLVGFIPSNEMMKNAIGHEMPMDILPLLPTQLGRDILEAEAVEGKDDLSNGYFAATGVKGEKDLIEETDPDADYRTHRFLDIRKPLIPQIWNGGFSKEFYLEQVHRPRKYTNSGSALLGKHLDPFSITDWYWYMEPITLLPLATFGSYIACTSLSSFGQAAACWSSGLALWTLVEYGLHRGLFHMDKYLADNRVAILIHFLLHGVHHYLPMDKKYAFIPLPVTVALASTIFKLAYMLLYPNWYAVCALCCGYIFGCTYHEITHYILHYHHHQLPAFYRQLLDHHMHHHYADYENGFGVTSRFWDKFFGTEPEAKRAQTKMVAKGNEYEEKGVRMQWPTWQGMAQAMLPIVILYNDLSGMLRSYAAYLGSKMLQTWNHLREPRLEEDRVRVIWTCQCGKRLWDDFKELIPGAAEQLRQDLDRNSSMTGGRGQRFSGDVQRPDNVQVLPTADMTGARSSPNSASNTAPPSGSASESSRNSMTPVIGKSTTGRPSAEEPPSSEKKFLLLCVARKNDTLRLVQLNVEHIKSDFDLFRMLQKVYKDHRGFLDRFVSPRKLISINFRKFERHPRERVVILSGQDFLPDRVNPKACHQDHKPPKCDTIYDLHPTPPDLEPYVGRNGLAHLLQHPHEAEEEGNNLPLQNVWLKRFPKKEKTRLAACPPYQFGLGWGIEFEEGWYMSWLIWWIVSLLVLGATGFLIYWWKFHHDVQGASGVGALLVAYATLIISIFAVTVVVG